MPEEQAGSYWDAIRSWADSLGLLNPREEQADADANADAEDVPRPKVPQAVCDNCPICQGAATVESMNPVVLHELTEIARSLLAGVGSALTQAAETRVALGRSRPDDEGEADSAPKPNEDPDAPTSAESTDETSPQPQ